MRHPCEIIYELSDRPVFGETRGMCRVLGREAVGVPFSDWVKDTFTDTNLLFPGNIISNEAYFCFLDDNKYLQQKLGRSEMTRFRNYSHFVVNGNWYVFTKAQKKSMYLLLIEEDPEIAVISDSGQRHLVFRHRVGTWQLEDTIIERDKDLLVRLKTNMDLLLQEGFSKDEIQSGKYHQRKILRAGLNSWQLLERVIQNYRGSKIFDLALWLSQNYR